MLTLISYLDVFGYQPKMLINNSSSHKSIFGGLVSFFVFVALAAAVWLLGNEIFYKQKPALIVSTNSDAKPMLTEFNDENYVITLGLQMPDYTMYVDESIYSVDVTHISMIRGENNVVNYITKKYETIRCSKKNITKLYDEYFKFLDLKNLLCLKNGSFPLRGSFGNDEFSFLEFRFKKCQNSTLNKNSCKPEAEINKRLAGGFFGMFLTDFTVLPTNFEKPTQTFGVNIWTTFSILAYREIWMYYKKVQISSDVGWLAEDKLQEDSFAFNNLREVWDYRDTSETFMNLNIAMGLNRMVYERSYIKVQQILANVGGILKVLLLMGQIVTFYFSKLNFQSFLVNHFYDSEAFTDREKETKRKKSLYNRGDSTVKTSNVHLMSKSPDRVKSRDYGDMELKSKDSISRQSSPINPKLQKSIKSPQIGMSSPSFGLRSSTKLFKNKGESLNLNLCDIIRSMGCSSHPLRKKLNAIKFGYSKILIQYDWINFIKNQNDIEILRETVFSKEQKDILALALRLKDQTLIYVKINF
jgi:hypothetical protein